MNDVETFVILIGVFCFLTLLFKYNDDDDQWLNPTS